MDIVLPGDASMAFIAQVPKRQLDSLLNLPLGASSLNIPTLLLFAVSLAVPLLLL